VKSATLALVRPEPMLTDRDHPADVALAERWSASPPRWVVLIGGAQADKGKDAAELREALDALPKLCRVLVPPSHRGVLVLPNGQGDPWFTAPAAMLSAQEV
jgi:hypothetical protein